MCRERRAARDPELRHRALGPSRVPGPTSSGAGRPEAIGRSTGREHDIFLVGGYEVIDTMRSEFGTGVENPPIRPPGFFGAEPDFAHVRDGPVPSRQAGSEARIDPMRTTTMTERPGRSVPRVRP